MTTHTTTSPSVSRAHHETDTKTVLGFWIYIMSDCVLFASLFATYAVLHGNTWGGPSARELFSLPFALLETMILLTSSFTAGLVLLAARQGDRARMLAFMGMTLVLGLVFLGLEISEFLKLIGEGSGPQTSAFLSAFFTLVGTHGLHVALGSLWLVVLGVAVFRRGFTHTSLRRIMCWSLFWHFLDIVWIFIFTFVYLMGALS